MTILVKPFFPPTYVASLMGSLTSAETDIMLYLINNQTGSPALVPYKGSKREEGDSTQGQTAVGEGEGSVCLARWSEPRRIKRFTRSLCKWGSDNHFWLKRKGQFQGDVSPQFWFKTVIHWPIFDSLPLFYGIKFKDSREMTLLKHFVFVTSKKD